jgi:hypothetical protein
MESEEKVTIDQDEVKKSASRRPTQKRKVCNVWDQVF